MMILGENYDPMWGLDEYDPYDPFTDSMLNDLHERRLDEYDPHDPFGEYESFDPMDELDFSEYEDEYADNHCFPMEG